MRTRIILSLVFVAGTSYAAQPSFQRDATAAEADAMYLGILNGQPYNESLSMLTDVGIKLAKARELLNYLAAEFEGREGVGVENTARLCRNENEQYLNPLVLADELKRQNAEEREFQASMMRQAKIILGVNSLRPIWRPHMNDPGISEDVDVVDLVLDGQLKPADAIARACQVTEQRNARFSYKSDST